MNGAHPSEAQWTAQGTAQGTAQQARPAPAGTAHRSDKAWSPVEAGARVRIPLADGTHATFVGFHGTQTAIEHYAVLFDGSDTASPALVRMHSECTTGDLFGSLRCDCGPQLQQSLDILKAQGGILIYLRQEGRGIGLAAKLEAYRLQDLGLDTYAANRALSLPADGRDYGVGAAMLRALGASKVRLLSNNPDKAAQLERHGIQVTQVIATGTFVNPFNQSYLAAKARLTGHSLSL